MWATLERIEGNEQVVRDAHYGWLDVRDGRLAQVRLRPWPKLGSRFEVWWCEQFGWRRRKGDYCRLFFNQPRSCPDYLNLPWMQSTAETTLKTVFAALDALDQIADIKESEAIVCELANPRLSDRLMRRLGWERHLEHAAGRHYIKRFERRSRRERVRQVLDLPESSVVGQVCNLPES